MKREEVIDKLIRFIWDSLESHLEYTYKKHPDGKDHHVQCVKDYAYMIYLASQLYEEKSK